jgi:hypothetical protein
MLTIFKVKHNKYLTEVLINNLIIACIRSKKDLGNILEGLDDCYFIGV